MLFEATNKQIERNLCDTKISDFKLSVQAKKILIYSVLILFQPTLLSMLSICQGTFLLSRFPCSHYSFLNK